MFTLVELVPGTAVPKLKAILERSTFTGVPGVAPNSFTFAVHRRKFAMYESEAAKALESLLALENEAAVPLTVLTARLFSVNGRFDAPLLA